MANDKNIKIGLETVGANAAAQEINKIPEAIEKIPQATPEAVAVVDEVTKSLKELAEEANAAQKAQRDADVQEVTRRNAEKEAAEALAKQLKQIAEASRALVAMQTVEMLKKTTAALREATEEGGVLHDKLGEIGPVLDTVDNGLNMMSVGLGTAVSTGNPLIGVLAGIAAGVGGVMDAYQKMTTQEDAARVAEQRAADMQIKYLSNVEFNKKNAALITQVEGITEENKALDDQEQALRRIIDLREKLSGQANTAARQEVQLAKLKGGDVSLAEANLIATELNGSLQTLNDKISAAKQQAADSTAKENAASANWQLAQNEVAAGLRDLWAKDTQDKKAAAESAAAKGEQDRQKLSDFIVTSANTREEIIRKGEIDLETKEKEYAGKTSRQAAAAFQGVYNTLVEEQRKIPETAQQAIAQIQADATQITSAADSKAQEVTAAIQKASTGAVQAISKVGTSANANATASNQAIESAGKQVKESIELLTDKVISVLSQVSAAAIANANKIATQQTQINQLFARQR